MESDSVSVSNLCPVLNGMLEIWHRPKLNRIPKLKADGFTHVVTILSEKEGAKKIISSVQSAGLVSIWIQVGSASLIDDEKVLRDLTKSFEEIRSVLNDGGKVYMHCSAGIHRTGMMTNALLLYCGYNEEDALSLLGQLRQITQKDVGQDRLDWGVQFYNAIRTPTIT
jgi:protein tyrosine phosphatase